MQTIKTAQILVSLSYEKTIRDDQWERIKDLLPPERKPQGGRSTPYFGCFAQVRHGETCPNTTAHGAAYAAFHASLQPIREQGKLLAALFQYPPWFDCTKENEIRSLV